IQINGTQVHVYDADDFTRRSIPGLLPRQLAPVPDNTFSITPRRGPPDPNASVGPSKAESAGVCPPSGVKNFASAAGAAFRDSLINQDPPGILRMYIRWDDTARADGTVHRYILHFFLEDGTVEMRELADAGGGHHFEGRFPVVIGRQKIFKGGKSRSLSVDRIGGDRATPRSARTTASGVRTAEDPRGGDVEEPLTPPDMVVGQTLVLMKRRMLVCGWDEAAHVWWENANGTSMRGRQVDMQEFQRCVRPSRSQPRPPNKTKSSFCEGPPNRPGTARGRFFKASENSGKTLRFLAKATSDTQTPSTSVNVFIIRFYPEDDTLSVYTSHNLGNNSGGLQKGVYLARRGDMINKDTGQPFKAGDFHIGFVASLPSVSLEVIDVDDFSRHHLVRGSPPACPEWQTSPMWQKLLNIAKRAWSSGGHDSTATAGSGPGTQKHAARVVSHSPGKKVTFFGNGNGNNGGAHPDSPDDGGGGSGGGGGDSLYGRGGHDGGGGDAAVANDMDTRISLGGAPRSPQKHPPSISSSPGCSPPSPWERLVLALLRRGVNVSLTAAKNNASRNVSYGGFEYPWVVAAGGPSPSVVVGNHQENELESRQTIPAEMAASGVVGTGVNKAASLDTPLDLRKVALEAHDLPKTGRQDQILKQAMASVLMHIFGRGGEAAVRDTLKAEGKTPGDPADLWTMSRLLMVAGELKANFLLGL
ncbi:unnamed protein product, partial [Laminaria digitata]